MCEGAQGQHGGMWPVSFSSQPIQSHLLEVEYIGLLLNDAKCAKLLSRVEILKNRIQLSRNFEIFLTQDQGEVSRHRA
jgi:hypothetical protein